MCNYACFDDNYSYLPYLLQTLWVYSGSFRTDPITFNAFFSISILINVLRVPKQRFPNTRNKVN